MTKTARDGITGLVGDRHELFTGRTVLITGAAGGIGMATAQQFAERGARLFLVDRQPIAESDLLSLTGLGAERVLAFQADVTDENAVEASYTNARDTLGGPHVVINIAGEMIYKAIAELTRNDWLASLSANILGAAGYVGLALRTMEPGGSIVNVSSVHAKRTIKWVAPYAVAKAGLVSLTRSAAIEGKPKGIRANVVLPGAVNTKLLRDSPLYLSGTEKLEPSSIGMPEEVAAAIVFLASERASFITGASLAVDGGRLAQL